MTARSFNGTSDYGRQTPAPVTAASLSFAIWYYANSLAVDKTLMGLFDNASTNHYFLLQYKQSVNALQGVSRSTTSGAASTSSAPSTGVWQHAAFTTSAINARAAYLNGGSKGTNTTSITPTAANIDSLSIGRWDTSAAGDNWDGYLAHAAVWNADLTDAEMDMLGAQRISPLAVRPQSLIRYFPFMGRDTADIDIIGGTSMTWTGTTGSGEAPPMLWVPGKRRIFIPATSGTTYTNTLESAVLTEDGTVAYLLRGRVQDDTAALVDEAQASALFNRAGDDTLTVFDDLRSAVLFNRLLGDALTLLDEAVTALKSSVLYTSTLTSSVALADEIATAVRRSRSLDDAFLIEDTGFQWLRLARMLSDDVAAFDEAVASLIGAAQVVVLTSNIGAVDDALRTALFSRLVASAADTSDSAVQSLLRGVVLSDGSTIVDAASFFLRVNRALESTVDPVDTLLTARRMATMLESLINLSDLATATITQYFAAYATRNAALGMMADTVRLGMAGTARLGFDPDRVQLGMGA